MAQVIHEKDIQDFPNPLADIFGSLAYIPSALVRSLKRVFGEKVTPNDYIQIWAEINEDGVPVRGSQSDYPELVLCANRLPESDNWSLTKQRREPASFVYDPIYGDTNMITPSYKVIEDFGALTTEQVQLIMSVSDPEPRSSWSHYSRAFN